jgi:hypothetical protein
MFYNPEFEFDEIDMIKIPEWVFHEKTPPVKPNDEDNIQYPVDTEYLEYSKPVAIKLPKRRNLSNWFLKEISREYRKIKNGANIDIEESIPDNICMVDDDDDTEFSNSIMLPSRRILPAWKLNNISKDFMKTNVCYSRKKKTYKKSSIAVDDIYSI